MTTTANALDGLLAIHDGNPTARWNFPAAVGTQAAAPGGIGTAVSLTYSYYETAPAGYEDAAGHFASFDETALGMRTAATAAMNAIAAVCNVVFAPAASGSVGQITFGMNVQSGSSGYAYFPNYQYVYEDTGSILSTEESPRGGDVWIDDDPRWTADDFLPGGFGFETLIHELGHALGLKHSFESSLETGGFVLDAAHDHLGFTMMSYTDAPHAAVVTAVDGGYVVDYVPVSTPMLGDIRALQHLYGANAASHAGDDVYRWSNREIFFETLWDGGGADVLDVSNQTLACTVDLTPGSYSSIGLRRTEAEMLALTPGVTRTMVANWWGSAVADDLYDGSNNLAIADGVIIEAANGGHGADAITGNAADNVLTGNGGADTLTGGSGNDRFVYSSALDSTVAAHDVIADFQSGDVLSFAGMRGLALPLVNHAFAASIAATIDAVRADSALGNAIVCFSDGAAEYVYVNGSGTGVSFDGTLIALTGITAAPGTASFMPTEAPAVDVSVQVYAWNTHELLGGVALDGTHSTGSDGGFTLSAVGASTLDLTPALVADATVHGAVNLADAIAILKLIVGLEVNGSSTKPLSPYQAIAADFDDSGAVDLSDAIGVLKHVVGLPTDSSPKWTFADEADATMPARAGTSPGKLASPVVVDVASHVGLVGILRGDVDGSWNGGGSALPDGYFDHLTAAGFSASQWGIYTT